MILLYFLQCQRSWKGQGWWEAEVNGQHVEVLKTSRRFDHCCNIDSCGHNETVVLFDCKCRNSKVTVFLLSNCLSFLRS